MRILQTGCKNAGVQIQHHRHVRSNNKIASIQQHRSAVSHQDGFSILTGYVQRTMKISMLVITELDGRNAGNRGWGLQSNSREDIGIIITIAKLSAVHWFAGKVLSGSV